MDTSSARRIPLVESDLDIFHLIAHPARAPLGNQVPVAVDVAVQKPSGLPRVRGLRTFSCPV